MDIAALSMAMSQNKIMSDVGVAMLSKNLDLLNTVGEGFVESVEAIPETSVNPNIGSNIDIRV